MLIALALVMASYGVSYASDSYKAATGKPWRSMIVVDKGGHEYVLNLTDRARIMFIDGNMVITDYISSTDIGLDEIAEWKMSETLFPEDVISGVESVEREESACLISYNNDKICVSSTGLSGVLRIVDMEGRVVSECTVVGSTAQIDSSMFAKGVYVVLFGNKSLKILVK